MVVVTIWGAGNSNCQIGDFNGVVDFNSKGSILVEIFVHQETMILNVNKGRRGTDP